jgi:uncharacterized membrane protein YfcA
MELTFFFLAALLLTGLLVGTASGLFGVGGGFILVPIQYWLLTASGLSADLAIRISFATSLAVILPTAVSGTYAHHCRRCIHWDAVVWMGVTAALVSYLGALLATHLPARPLEVIFAVVLILGAFRMYFADLPSCEIASVVNSRRTYLLWGIPVGFLSGLLGIGGGILMVPVMVVFFKFPIHHAIGTSTPIILFTAAGGLISYIINGLGVAGLPPYSLGYVNLINALILAVATIPMAQVGAWLAHRVSGLQLRGAMVFVMCFFGLKMLGLFSWLGLPF